jgi:hypothetical protein
MSKKKTKTKTLHDTSDNEMLLDSKAGQHDVSENKMLMSKKKTMTAWRE